MAEEKKILDLIPETLHEQLFKEVEEKLKEKQKQGPTKADVEKSIRPWAQQGKQLTQSK